MRHAGTDVSNGSVRGLLMTTALATSLLALSLPVLSSPAGARSPHHAAPAASKPAAGKPVARTIMHRQVVVHRPAAALRGSAYFTRVSDTRPVAKLGAGSKLSKNAKARVVPVRAASGGLQCVPFARAVSGIEIKGNAFTWWDSAAGLYERGQRPEPGSVLNFRANSTMRLGHVAVVKRVINSREIEIDHANWAYSGKGNITRDVSVIDVSARNDWSAVRVEVGRSGTYGNIYATYGFIYDRPDRGTMVANSRPAAPARVTPARSYEEVAEAPMRSLR